MIKYRIDMAQSYLEDAVELYNQNRYNSAISRAYYASYQAMWSALGEPQDSKIWRHLAIIKHFVRGYWFKGNHSKSGPGLLEDKRLPLRRLYALRIKSDYDCIAVRNEEVDRSIKIVSEIIEIIKGK